MSSQGISKQINKNVLNTTKKYWSKGEDKILCQAMDKHGSDWKMIAHYFTDRNASQCAQRWKRIKPKEYLRKKWTEEEDCLVIKLASLLDYKWTPIAKYLPNRSARQIRLRYMNQLKPEINRNEWTEEEDLIIWKMYKKMGSKWTEIAKKLTQRTENMVKNRYYGCLRKKFGKQDNPYYVVPQPKTEQLNIKLDTTNEIKQEENIEEKDSSISNKFESDNQDYILTQSQQLIYTHDEIKDYQNDFSQILQIEEEMDDVFLTDSNHQMQLQDMQNQGGKRLKNLQQSFDFDDFQMI